MTFETNIKLIKKLVSVLGGKDSDVSITYKGTGYGVTKPWHIRCDTKEINHETHDGGAKELVAILKVELQKKISDAEKQADDYRKALGSLDN